MLFVFIAPTAVAFDLFQNHLDTQHECKDTIGDCDAWLSTSGAKCTDACAETAPLDPLCIEQYCDACSHQLVTCRDHHPASAA